jgi:PBP1b-binding outer membrane lipoprotein LpoB
MKKVFMLMLAAAFFASCNNAADNTSEAKDSLDSIASEKKEKIDSTTEEKKEAIDSLANKADSVDHKKDSADHK